MFQNTQYSQVFASYCFFLSRVLMKGSNRIFHKPSPSCCYVSNLRCPLLHPLLVPAIGIHVFYLISHDSEFRVFLPGLNRFYQHYSFMFCMSHSLFWLKKKFSEYNINILQLWEVLKIWEHIEKKLDIAHNSSAWKYLL